jgi:hypothetical protein
VRSEECGVLYCAISEESPSESVQGTKVAACLRLLFPGFLFPLSASGRAGAPLRIRRDSVTVPRRRTGQDRTGQDWTGLDWISLSQVSLPAIARVRVRVRLGSRQPEMSPGAHFNGPPGRRGTRGKPFAARPLPTWGWSLLPQRRSWGASGSRELTVELVVVRDPVPNAATIIGCDPSTLAPWPGEAW